MAEPEKKETSPYGVGGGEGRKCRSKVRDGEPIASKNRATKRGAAGRQERRNTGLKALRDRGENEMAETG